ncbi:MAG: hypothetical protein MZV64_19425 [Ignavibacteriales bacterium]|nr:hypothetical protein [Ignavibacteriales bacterium]
MASITRAVKGSHSAHGSRPDWAASWYNPTSPPALSQGRRNHSSPNDIPVLRAVRTASP